MKQNISPTYRRFGTSVGGLFCAICVLSPSPAQAECRQWEFSRREWSLKQGDLTVTLDVRRSGKNLSGNARYVSLKKVSHTGKVLGTIDGNNITLDIEWDDASGGLYKGVIGHTGLIRGTVNVDKADPTNNWRWIGLTRMFCADDGEPKSKLSPSAAPPQPSPKRLISPKGKGRTAVNAPAPTEPSAPSGAPRITVSNKPGQPAGTQTITWDGGPNHPYAEVWVKVDGADETKIVEQGKGTREVTVEAGKTYQYILTDSGQQLATTTVKAK